METMLGILAMAALAAGVIGWLWITVMAFSEGETLWGVGCMIISPLCIVYGLMNFQELKLPFFLVLGGFVGRIAIGAITIGMS
ncbi:hypothetical protein [Aureliella helgolandensis]|uniref:Major facilitator superfamily (MFS) profile domain-containing protein n=1 Tax=Aureliella helgolandensis TaxID=2527968 RepID=A0A518GEE4_9BACT|nr:hypothetical protein [Aureliella helgolandensis]QDV26969.1 hypothetical protein Q31a_53490 [Aureliella helgolandensis]